MLLGGRCQEGLRRACACSEGQRVCSPVSRDQARPEERVLGSDEVLMGWGRGSVQHSSHLRVA